MKKFIASLLCLVSLSSLAQTSNAPTGITVSGSNPTSSGAGGLSLPGVGGTTNAPGTNTGTVIPQYPVAILVNPTNSTLVSPTNFFVSNSNLIAAVVTAGTVGSSSSNSPIFGANLIPTNATYGDGNDPLGLNAYQLPFNLTNGAVYIFVADKAGHILEDSSPTTIADTSFDPVVVFQFVASSFSSPYLIADNAGDTSNGSPVKAGLYAAPGYYSNNLAMGQFIGDFKGSITGHIGSNSTVETGALGSDVLTTSRPIIGNAQAGVLANIIGSSNTSYGSTLYLWNHGTTPGTNANYADIGFFTGGGASIAGANLRGALGVGLEGLSQFPYNTPYWECYNHNSFWFVEAGSENGIFGGVPTVLMATLFGIKTN